MTGGPPCVTRMVNGKPRAILTHDRPDDFPVAGIVDLQSQCWKIGLGYRELKQYLLKNCLALRSGRPDLIRQELRWGAGVQADAR